MILVGLSGAIGSGKTTFSKYLSANEPQHGHWESWELIAEIGNGLLEESSLQDPAGDYSALNEWLGPLGDLVEQVTHRQLLPESRTVTAQKVSEYPQQFAKLFEFQSIVQRTSVLQQGIITAENKEQYRSLLQWLGGYLAKNVRGDIWYAEIVRRILVTPSLELATVGGVRFPADAEVIRNAGGKVFTIQRPGIEVRDITEITERESSLITADTLISNSGSLDQLLRLARTVYLDLKNNCLKPEYSTG